MTQKLQKNAIVLNMDKNTIRLASPVQEDSFVDGPGIRMVIWTQGCIHHCKNCHNPQTWDLNKGTVYSVEDIKRQIKESQLQTGLTLSGGEPFLQVEPLLEIVKVAKEKGLNIWAYSGFTYEEILADEIKKQLLCQLDVLVDGKFIEDLKDYRLVFKGSKNQRIIDVPTSLATNTVVLSDKDKQNQNL